MYRQISSGVLVFMAFITPIFYSRTPYSDLISFLLFGWFMTNAMYLTAKIGKYYLKKRDASEAKLLAKKEYLLNLAAYKLRLSVKLKITEIINAKFSDSFWGYEKQESFLIFLNGGQFPIWIKEGDLSLKATVFINSGQEIFVDIEKPEKNTVRHEINKVLTAKTEADAESDFGYSEEMSISDWFENECSIQLQDIIAANNLTNFLINQSGEVYCDSELLGDISNFPDISKWDELAHVLSDNEIDVEILNENLMIRL